MSHTQKRMAAGFEALCAAVNVSPLPFLQLDDAAAAKEAVSVLTKISELSDAGWGALPPEAQALFDKAAEAVNQNQSPLSVVLETVVVPDKNDSKPESAKAPEPAQRKPVTRTVQSNDTGETKAATEVPKGRFGGGQRKNPGTDWARKYVLANPEKAPAEVLKATLEQNFPHPISKGTVDSLVFEMRSALRIIKEEGFKLVKA